MQHATAKRMPVVVHCAPAYTTFSCAFNHDRDTPHKTTAVSPLEATRPFSFSQCTPLLRQCGDAVTRGFPCLVRLHMPHHALTCLTMPHRCLLSCRRRSLRCLSSVSARSSTRAAILRLFTAVVSSAFQFSVTAAVAFGGLSYTTDSANRAPTFDFTSRNRRWPPEKRNTNIRTVRGDKAAHDDRRRVSWRS